MKKVLIVDDSSYMRLFIKKVIEKGGLFTTIEAATDVEAIEMFKTEKPDIVTLDMNMAENRGEGIDMLTNMITINPEAVVIIVSAEGYENSKDECLKLGAKEYIKKPFETETLLKTLENYK